LLRNVSQPVPIAQLVGGAAHQKLKCRLKGVSISRNVSLIFNKKRLIFIPNQGGQLRPKYPEGKSVFVEGMTANSGKEFSAHLQVDADKRGIGFRFDQQQEQVQKASEQRQVRIPDSLLGKDLTEEQQQKLEKRETIYVSGMKDKKGEDFNAYIKVNDEKGKLDFYKWNPDKAQTKGAEVIPDNKSKTQVAVNSEGKTNEATKGINEPLTKEQIQPSEQQQNSQRNRSKVHSI